MQKRWVKAAVGAAVVLIVIFGVVPFFINANTFRPKIETELSSSLGRKVTLGHLSFSLLRGSLIADEISVADDPAYSTAPFLEAKQLRLGIELGQFLFHHSVHITTLVVDSPSIHLIHAENGMWNFSNLGGSNNTKPASQQESVLPVLSVNKVEINNGSATVSSLPAAGNPFTCTAINLSVKQFSMAQQFPFELSLKTAGGGSLDLKGSAGPIPQSNAAATPFQATLNIRHFDPVKANVVAASDGISMVADFDGQVASDGTNLTSKGNIVASNLRLARNGSPTTQPVKVDYAVEDNLQSRAGRVSDSAIHTGTVAAHINGGFKSAGQSVVLDLHLSAPNLPVDQLEDLLPAVGVNLPSGSRLSGGTLSANLAITGSANALTIAGPVEIDNSKLAGFDLGSRIQGINPLGGTSGGTEFQKLSTDVNSSPQSTQLKNIDASVPQIGTATGEGTVSPSGALNFQLTAAFNNSNVVGTAANGAVNAISGLLGNKSSTTTNHGLPMIITGTTAHPSIRVNMGAMLKQQISGQGNLSGQQNNNPLKTLKGIFGK